MKNKMIPSLLSCALVVGALTLSFEAMAICKPSEDVTDSNHAQPLRDCPSASQSVLQRILGLFKSFG